MFESSAAFFIVGMLVAWIIGRTTFDAWRWREVFGSGLGASRDDADALADRLQAQGIHARVVVTGRGMGLRLGRAGAPDLTEGYSVRVRRRDEPEARTIVEAIRAERSQ